MIIKLIIRLCSFAICVLLLIGGVMLTIDSIKKNDTLAQDFEKIKNAPWIAEVEATTTTSPEGGEQNPEGGEQTPEGGEQTPEGGEQNPEGGEQNPEGGEQTPEGGEQTPEGGEQTPEA